LGSNTAHVLVTDNADVTLLTPRGTPGVLDNPVVLTSISTITNSEDTVVELSTARGIIKDTRGVELEGELVSLDSNGDGSESYSAEEIVLITLDGGLVTRELDNGSAGLARAINTSVRVSSLGADTIVLENPLESRVHETTVAAFVTSGTSTVNELLLRDGDESTSTVEPSTLNGAGSREGPA